MGAMTSDLNPVSIGTPLSQYATKVALLGSGELGKEVAIELQRLGVEVVAIDGYENAPAMQVAHRSYVVNMQDETELRDVLEEEKPDLIIPEIEAIKTSVLGQLEAQQPWPLRVIPTAQATILTMDREGIRRLAAEKLGLLTSPYAFVSSLEELQQATKDLGFPCVLKPVMSSSGKGQSVIHEAQQIQVAWQQAQTASRTKSKDGQSIRCIVEGFVDFDDEITILTVRRSNGTQFFDPIHHTQINGDYAESWQDPSGQSALSGLLLQKAQEVSKKITDALGGLGVFGVELFLKGQDVIFSEVSPRPHDTGLVTLVSGDKSEFAVHAQAVLGIPAPRNTQSRELSPPATRFAGASASYPIKVEGNGIPVFTGLDAAYSLDESIQVRLFGKPNVTSPRRVAVVLARGKNSLEARALAKHAAEQITVSLH